MEPLPPQWLQSGGSMGLFFVGWCLGWRPMASLTASGAVLILLAKRPALEPEAAEAAKMESRTN